MRINKFLVMLVTTLLSFTMIGCGNDNDDADNVINAPQELFGTWNLYGMKVTFNPDGTGTMTGDFGDEESVAAMARKAHKAPREAAGVATIKFTYTYNGTERTIILNMAGETERWKIVELSDNLLVIIDSEGDKISLVKEGSSGKPDMPGIDYKPCPLSTLIGDWGVAGRAVYGFNSEGFMKFFFNDGEHFESSRYSYNEETGRLLSHEGDFDITIKKISDNVIMIWGNYYEEEKAPALLSRITGKPFSVGNISLLYNKTWTMVGVADLDNKPAYPWTYYFDAKGIWSMSVQGDVMGGNFSYDNSKKVLTLEMYGEKMDYEVLNLTETNLVLGMKSEDSDVVQKMELTVLP